MGKPTNLSVASSHSFSATPTSSGRWLPNHFYLSKQESLDNVDPILLVDILGSDPSQPHVSLKFDPVSIVGRLNLGSSLTNRL